MKKFFALFLAVLLGSAVLCAGFLAPMTASAAGSNLAQGKQITGADPTSGNQYTDKYNASLLDGIASDEFDPNGAPGDWFSYYYNASYPSNAAMTDSGVMGSFTVDLAGNASVESVRLHMFATDAKKSSGIQPPYRIAVEHSADNETWNAFAERTDFSGCKDIDWVEIAAPSAVNARYIKVSVYYAGPTLLLNEVQVIGEMAQDTNPPADARFEVFDLTPVDADVDWYEDGRVFVIPNEGDEELSVASGNYPLRYMFILLFDKDGVCFELGNNLLSADDELAASYPQHDIKIPAGGFAVIFYYNANEGPSNLALYEYYEELGGAAVSNETVPAARGKNYTAEIENNTVTVYFASAVTSTETPTETSSEPSAEETTSPEPAEPSSEAPSEPAAGTSSTEKPAADADSSTVTASTEPLEESSPVGIILGIVIAVVAVAAVAIVVVILKRKKK